MTAHHANIVTPTRLALYFVAPSPENALHSGLYFDGSDEAWQHIRENGLDGYTVYSFWVYPDPDSIEECVG